LDRPFGGPLRIRGDFGEDARPIVDFYRIEYRKDSMPPGAWIDTGSVPGLLGAFARAYWDFGAVTFSPPVPSGPLSVDGRVVYMTRYKYERDNPGAPGGSFIWDDWDTLFIWNTESLPQGDGLYAFRLIGYRQAADGTLVDERVMPLCGAEDEDPPTPASVMVLVDNRIIGVHPPSIPSHPCGPGTVHLCTVEPDCDFVSVVKNEGAAGQGNINACDIVTIADTDTVTIHYLVTTPATVTDSHLLAYELTAHYGESNVFNVLGAGTMAGDPTLQFGPTYDDALAQGASRPFWRGGSFKVTLPGSAFPASCAYLLRLRSWKRTTDGCTDPYYFHANVCELSFCVIKP
ncbi:MAG: hypothetical protein Q8R28_01560, partial [Dehalococcoidia bacterium]|nr:hypothetical protein [Dehalococcoidia bacterium]